MGHNETMEMLGRIADLEAALRFYAQREHYPLAILELKDSELIKDNGNRARAALAGGSAARVDDLEERIQFLNNIALSAVGLKVTIEAGLWPTLDALNRDLDAFQRRYGEVKGGH